MGLIDDEEDVAALAGQLVDGGVELGEETAEAESGLGLEANQDLLIESGDGKVGVGEIDYVIEIAVQGMGEGAQGRGLAGAHVTGDEGRELVQQGNLEAPLHLLMAAGGVESVGGHGLGKGCGGKAVDVIEGHHRTVSPLG